MAGPIVSAPTVGRDGVTLVITPPLHQVAAKLQRLGIRLRNFDDLWDRIEKTMGEIETAQFDTRGHGTWPPLAASTVERKQRMGFPYPDVPLVATGEMKRRYTDPRHAADRGPGRMVWGGDPTVAYARHHQAPEIPGRPPERKIIDLTVADRRKLERDTVAFMNDAVTRQFGRL